MGVGAMKDWKLQLMDLRSSHRVLRASWKFASSPELALLGEIGIFSVTWWRKTAWMWNRRKDTRPQEPPKTDCDVSRYDLTVCTVLGYVPPVLPVWMSPAASSDEPPPLRGKRGEGQ